MAFDYSVIDDFIIDYAAIGKRIRRHREMQGLSLKRLAGIADIGANYLSHVERGATKLSLPNLIYLTRALGITADALLCENLVARSQLQQTELADDLLLCTDAEVDLVVTQALQYAGYLRANRPRGDTT